MQGRVTKYFQDRGFGFIHGGDGNAYFIHHSKLNGKYIDRGYYVFFKSFRSDRSDYNAKDVMVIETTERKKNNGKKHK